MHASLVQIYDRRVAEGALSPDAAQRAVLPRLEAIRAALEAPARAGLFRRRPPPPRGLYLWGGVGRGKSMLMDLFADTIEAPKRRVHFHAFMQDVHARLHIARQSGVEDALAPVAADLARGLKLLAFDEMQITDITDAMVVGRLFQMLMAAGVVIVTTSNRPPEDLYKNGLNRALFVPFIELLREKMDILELQSETDYRRERLSGAKVYFHPADASARAAMEGLWAELTGGDPGAPLVLQVQGRNLRLPHHHSGTARAGFWDLCGQPLGPADYLAIARSLKVLMIEDIPRLSAANYNEAKRFVTLIDALYEARVRLIASAADMPERLYVEGSGAFEFERTASRLAEMQAEGWGQSD